MPVPLNQKAMPPRSVRMLLLLAFALFGADHGSYAKPQPKVHVIDMEAVQFAPQMVEVGVGDTVTWKNEDPFPHTVTAEDRSFDSGEIGAGRSWKFEANKKGVFQYICTLHPTMKGRLSVK